MQKHILTIAVEDYFHVAALRGAVLRKHWERLDPRLEANLDASLELLDRYGMKGTFFVFGCIADGQPGIVERIIGRGHEVASRSYWPRSVSEMSRQEFVDDLGRAKEALERAGANRIVGYRAPEWLAEKDLWILDILAEEGYLYDSSINPFLRRFARRPELWRIHRQPLAGRNLWEFPIATMGLFGVRVAVSGGNYIRQLPHTALSRAVAWQAERSADPMVFYFMPWELDRDQPLIQGISTFNRVRHYRNLAKTRWVLEDYFRRYQFQGIADHLGVLRQDGERRPERPVASAAPLAAGLMHAGPEEAPAPNRTPVTLVVPIYNEQKTLRYFCRTLLEFKSRLSRQYRIHLVLVDDGSSDETWSLLNALFLGVSDATLCRHEKNLGVAAALLTGIRRAPTEIVCSIDCDCSYDPQDLARMIPLIHDADMVTASPYHPSGSVLNVPRWRLFLSKTLSRMYSTVLRDRIYTYTSCCRVYRKSAVEKLSLEHGGFLGVAEMLIRLQKAGGRIVEYPATLESRLLGESKMKIVRTMASHLELLGDLAYGRVGVAGARQPDAPRAAD